ncbi:MAG: DUF4864 domain-containing protein [Pseudomonadota bacterium]
MRRIVLAILGTFLLFTGVSKADPLAVRATISAQLDAFRAGDADAAYTYAAPSIRQMFPTAEGFIRMVRRGYRPVYEARDAVFLRAQEMPSGGYAQEVGFTDATGDTWTALYTLAQQSDGSWRITGCYLRKSGGRST